MPGGMRRSSKLTGREALRPDSPARDRVSIHWRTGDQSDHAEEFYPQNLKFVVTLSYVCQGLFQARGRNVGDGRALTLLARPRELIQISLAHSVGAGPEPAFL